MMRTRIVNTLLLCLLPSISLAQLCNSSSILESTPAANFVTAIPAVDPTGKYAAITTPLPSNGEEVLDLTTGLVWQRCSKGQTWIADQHRCAGIPLKYTWKDALALSSTTSKWRVPNIKELTSLIDFRCQAPPLNPEIFPDTPASVITLIGGTSYYGTGYWSSTPNLSPGTDSSMPKIGAWIMDLNTGSPMLFSVEANNTSIVYAKHFVRLVRSN
ncbi:MAG: DUF1566 domain-containing protein [Gammaproteobacteria bacterium]|nr:DUF1566 domain-containing protein [Gammaproteobacteria bacterium]